MDGQQNHSYPGRPWPRVPSVRDPHQFPEPGAHGRIADGSGPGPRLIAHIRWSAAFDSERRRAVCKTVGLAHDGSNPSAATHFPRSKLVVPDGVTGFRVADERFRRPSVRVCGPAVGRIESRTAARISFQYLLKQAKRLSVRLLCGLCPFGVGVVHGLSAGRAGNPRTHSGRRPRPSRGRCNHRLSTDGHGPPPVDLSRTWPIAGRGGRRGRGCSGCTREQDRDAVSGPRQLI